MKTVIENLKDLAGLAMQTPAKDAIKKKKRIVKNMRRKQKLQRKKDAKNLLR
jgi:hypothetical protein